MFRNRNDGFDRVHVVGPEAAQAGVDRVEDVLARKAAAEAPIKGGRSESLGSSLMG